MMGHPDSVMAMTEEYPLPASGTVEYKYFEIPTNFAEDKYVQAIEVVPGNRAVVHHVIVFARAPLPPAPPPDVPRPQPQPAVFKFAPDMEQPKDPEREAKKKGPANDRPAPQRMGSFVGGFAPGQNMRLYEPGQAIKVPAGSVLVFQMHYTPNGTATADRTSRFHQARPINASTRR